jgi:aminoglycoside phosphotransferase
MTLARDAAVPHRDALLDGGAVGRALGVGPCERTYAKYRVGDSLRVVHRTRGGAVVAARSFADPDAVHARAAEIASPVGGQPGVAVAPGLGAVLWRFPNDRRLAALPLLAGPSAALDALAGAPVAATRLLAYAAERSATAACLDAGGTAVAYAKVHAGDGAARERAATEWLGSELGAGAAHLRLPRLVGSGARGRDGAPADATARGDDGGALAFEALPGRRLDAIPAGGQAAAHEALGRALAALHGLRPPPATRFGRVAPLRLVRAVGVIATARPASGRPAAELLAALLGRAADAAGPDVCMHGDANPRNALLDGGRVSLIDLEDAGAGPAAADLGHVLAGLLCARVAGALPAAAEPPLVRALLRGYARIAPLPRAESLAWHTAASVLGRRLPAAVSRVRDAELRRLDDLLLAAGALVR